MLSKVKKVNISLEAAAIPYECSKTTNDIHANAVHLIGFGFDGTACFRKGTKAGPEALRAVSDGIESYSPYLDLDLEDVSFYDLGNLSTQVDEQGSEHATIAAQWQTATDDFFQLFSDAEIKNNHIKVLTLGGEHSISYAPLKTYLAQYPDLVVIHLDAHADLRDGYLGFHYSHAAIMRRALDHFGEQHQLIQYGIRSGTKEEYQWMSQHNTLKQSRQAFLASVEKIANTRPIYLTFDLDYFDPSFFPGTGTPEPGGEDFHSFVSLCKILRKKNFVGCDVVELSPEIDSTGNSDVFAAKVVRELILCLNENHQ
ncbi:agmatinase [Litorilituus sediminis]|uniref:Agmatinase n=1 Tax=Litorilituus sediminis TaxID=718192 RepID=A0A4P6P2J6_9GAMM|nr:agmatinase [Litorilituus sediminis]QBG35413.1 agmatinase [Litorilituus sediminis]